MAKKKKTNPIQAQKLAKAQHRNEYIQKLEFWCNKICGEKVFKHLPSDYIDFIYACRCRSFKLEIAQEYSGKREIIKDCEMLIMNPLKNENCSLSDQLQMVSFNDFYTVCLSLSLIKDDIDKKRRTFGSYVDEILMKLEIFQLKFEDISKTLNITLCAFGYHSSEMGKQIYWLNYDFCKQTKDNHFLRNIITIQNNTLEMDSISIDNSPRPIIRVGWPFANFGIDYISIKPNQLGVKSQFADIPMNVYIQSHALMRLSERIDSFYTGILHLNIFYSLKDLVFCYDKNGRILIEYRIFDVKVGYFRADIIEGKIILRTFLFITNNGTPESQKLKHNTGLQKFDIEYLAINKLSSFMNSDISNNEAVKKILIDADCQCLLELYDKLKNSMTKTTDTFDSESLLHYLQYKKSEEIEVENCKETMLCVS